MNKKFLAIAVSAAMLAPAFASADVKLFGRVQVEYNVEDSDATGVDSVQAVDDNAGQSRIGIQFSEKLGGGLTAFGKAEFRIDPADNSSGGTNGTAESVSGALGQRDVHVGLKSSWGSLAAGSFNSPYKTAGGVKWDPWTATHLQARRAGGMSGGTGIGGHNGFMRNTIYYTSPNVNGFQAQFAIAPDETNADATENIVDGDNDYSLALQYKNGPWHAIFAHNRNNNPSAMDDETLTKVGLRWNSGAITLAGQYEVIKDADRAASGFTPGDNNTGQDYHAGTVGAGQNDADILWLNGQYKAGNNIFTLSWGNTDVDGTGANPDADYDYWAVGVIHKFSKQTRIFGGYTQTDGDNNGNANDRDAWSVGIRKDF
ncbi:porin [Sulfuriflexus sp.]|uniref:porin n=1 Tax=Sulfuriflexus sp. TaxID=2015443 RepID=UPI0028CD5428|nr:porin [Sulfuriflexus sp.]MDT8405509.1 porin [Sulfuriflexus sp.]